MGVLKNWQILLNSSCWRFFFDGGVLRLLECFEIFLNFLVKERIKDKRGKEKDETFFKKNREKKEKNSASRHNFLYEGGE